MSLKIFSTAALLGAIVFTVSFVSAKPEAKSRISLINKARGVMQVNLVEKSFSGDSVTLEAHVITKLQSVQIEWKVPSGAALVGGTASEVKQKDSDGNIVSTVTVRVTGALAKPHVVFAATTLESGENIGSSALYRLAEPNPAASEENLELMKNHFKYHQNKIVK